MKYKNFEVKDNMFLKRFLWVGTLLAMVVFSVVVHLYRRQLDISIGLEMLLLAIAASVYIFLVSQLHLYLSDQIHALVVPEGTERDGETARMISVLSLGVIVLFTTILFLLIFDYFGHAGTLPPLTSTSGPKVAAETKPVEEGAIFLGTYGDFFGGVLNPILTFGTLIALAITILMQRLQLRDARQEAKTNGLHAKKQIFETTFFNLLNLHSENVKNLRFDENAWDASAVSGASHAEGRAVFAAVLNRISYGVDYADTQLLRYRKLQKEHNYILGHYFRHIYQILDLVDLVQIDGTPDEKYKFQKRYTNILRAQLSSHELILLLLNCTKDTVDTGRFRKLVVRYEILEHLPASGGEVEIPSVPGLGARADQIFEEYFPKPIEAFRNKYGAFGKNEVFIRYIERMKLKSPPPTEDLLNHQGD